MSFRIDQLCVRYSRSLYYCHEWRTDTKYAETHVKTNKGHAEMLLPFYINIKCIFGEEGTKEIGMYNINLASRVRFLAVHKSLCMHFDHLFTRLSGFLTSLINIKSKDSEELKTWSLKILLCEHISLSFYRYITICYIDIFDIWFIRLDDDSHQNLTTNCAGSRSAAGLSKWQFGILMALKLKENAANLAFIERQML